MKQAIDLSRNFTAALEQTQSVTLAELDALASAIDRERSRQNKVAEGRADALRRLLDLVAIDANEREVEYVALRDEVLAIRARVADGSDDGARLIAEALAPRVEIREAAE